ncbi:MAG: GDSL-type esterase/lipase family protein [Chloroflexota bacterium]|nr:GDSL-type esterase/lipase family protein [Chloroflexota bacterium]
MTRRFWPAALVAAAMLIGLAPAAIASPPLPASMAAVGDSITQAASTGGSLGTDYPANSWSTGTNSTVNSHYLRLLALNPGISGKNYNRSVSGAKMADLDGQMQNVVALQPDYLTVLIGGNDLCTDTAVEMTEVSDFRSQFETAMATLASGSPNTNIYLSSIPNVYHLWELFKGNWWARFIWSVGGICQSLLANPTSTNQTDVDRRATVAQRNVDYNTQLEQVCAQYARCLWDGEVAYTTVFTSSDVSGDYFHPSISGQAKLAAVSWGAGYWADGAPPPPPPPTNQSPTASFTYSCTYLACSFDGSTSSDPDGSIASYAWTFGGDGSGSGVAPGHTFSAAGTYSVSLVVTDNGGATGTTSQPVTVSAPPVVQTMTISALTPSAGSRKGGWTATVTIEVRDGSGAPLVGATVTGAWSSGTASTCTTGSGGTCSDSLNVGRKTTSATWTVSNVAKDSYTYVPGSLTSVTVYRP